MKKYIAPSIKAVYILQTKILAGSLKLGDGKPSTDDSKNNFARWGQLTLEEEDDD